MPWNLRRSWTPQPSMLLSWRLCTRQVCRHQVQWFFFMVYNLRSLSGHEWSMFSSWGVWMSLVQSFDTSYISHHFCPRKADCWGLQRACWDLCSGTAWPEIIGICEVELKLSQPQPQTVQKISTVLLPLANRSWISWTNPKSSKCESQERSVSNMCCH